MTVSDEAMGGGNSRREEIIGNARLILGDCRDVLPTLGAVDAVVTSPPYDDIREYGGHPPVNCLAIINHIANLLTIGGVCVWNVADQVKDGSETGTSFRHALHAMECGLRLHDTMIACKEGVTFPDSNRYHPAFEYVFVLSKGAPAYFNGIKDWRNKHAGSLMHGTDRQRDGSVEKTNNCGVPVPTLGLRRNWWIVANPYSGETKGHPAPMAYSLAADHINTWTMPGSVVCDPFLGSGTTGVACAKLGRNFVGIEIHEPFFDIACERIFQAQRQSDLFITPPASPAPVTADLFA